MVLAGPRTASPRLALSPRSRSAAAAS